MQSRLSDLSLAEVSCRDLITEGRVSPSTHVDQMEVFPHPSIRVQITEGGWWKNISLLESGKVVNS